MPSVLRSSAIALCSLALLATAAPVAVAQQDDEQRRSYLAGNGFLSRGMDALAVEEYRSFLQEHPDHADAPTARYGLGVALQRLGRHEEAIEAIDAIKTPRGFRYATESQIVAANAEFTLGRFGRVSNRLAPMIETAEQQSVEAVASLLVESLHREEEHDAAIRAAQSVLDRFTIRTLGPRGALFAALSAERAGEGDLAETWAGWVAQQSDQAGLTPVANLCLARLALGRNDNARAIGLAQSVAQDGPEHSRTDALNILAEGLNRAGRTEEADRVYARLESGGGGSVLLQRGVIAFEQGRYEEALRFFERGDDGSERTARWAARCESRLGQHDDAADRLAGIDRPSPGAIYELAAAYRASDQSEDAAAAFTRFLSASDESTEPLAQHAMLAVASIELENANYRGSADRCRAILTDSSVTDAQVQRSARLLLAESLYLDGDLEGAGDAYADCLKLDPSGENSAMVAYRLGMINAQLGDTQIAETILRSVTRGASTPVAFAPGLRTLGDIAMSGEDWDAAAGHYRAFLQVGEADAATKMKLGITLSRLEQHEQALELIDRAIEGDLVPTQRSRAFLERGDVRQTLGNEAGAADDWRRALRLDTDGAIGTAASQRLSSMALASGDTDAAREQLTALIRTTTDATAKATAMLDLGRLELRSGDAAQAAQTIAQIPGDTLTDAQQAERFACLSIACARSGDDSGAARADEQLVAYEDSIDDALKAPLLYERAWRLRRASDHAGAIAAYRSLRQVAPESAVASSAALELSDLLLATGDTDGAIVALSELAATEQADLEIAADASLRLGTLYYNEGRPADAVDAMQALLDRADPDDRGLDHARLLCGESLFRLGLWASAVEHLQIASESDDDAIAEPALLRLGESAAQLQRWSVSESAYAAHLDRYAGSPHAAAALFGVGWALESAGRHKEAIEQYRKAAQGRTETAARAQFQLGECLFALGRHQEAASELIKVDILYAFPNWSAAALYEAGRCFDAIGEREQAIAQWQRVTEIEDAGEWAAMAQARLGGAATSAVATEASENTPTSNDID